MSKRPMIEIKDLCKSFGTKKVLQGVTLTVHEGESLVVIGGSGSGKSVLLKCILGLLPPDSGSIKVDGEELVGAKREVLERARHKISMLFQAAALFDSLPVWHNVAFRLLQDSKVSREEAKARAIERLKSVGLSENVADLYPAELSGGMQRRVGLARAVIHNPQIIFFDEPTAGLDPIIGSVINGLINKSVQELGATAITITHDMASARQVGDRIAMIYDGNIIWDGPAKEVENSGNPYVNQFIHGLADGPIKVAV